MSAMDHTAIKAALRAWVVRGSGLAASNVIWTLGERRPTGPYISMRLGIETIGQDWVDAEANPTPTAGHEAVSIVRGTRKLRLDMQCFAAVGDSSAADAWAILHEVMTAAALPTVSDQLEAAKLGLAKYDGPTQIDGVVNSSRFEPRATATAWLFTTAEVSETGPSYDNVEATASIETPSGDDLPDQVFTVQ